MADVSTPVGPYFASLPVEDLAKELTKKVDNFYNWLTRSGQMALYRRAYEFYYRSENQGASLNSAG